MSALKSEKRIVEKINMDVGEIGCENWSWINLS
jgi:hypothetical protein